MPTFFPVARSLQPADEIKKDYEAVPLALSSSGSWAETNLKALENGEATFDPTQGDLQGPLPIAVAVERKSMPLTPTLSPEGRRPQGPTARLVAVGDSDFVTNAYVQLSGNSDFALNIIQWLSQDDRFISIHPRQPEFKPLFLTSTQRTVMLFIVVVALPVLALVLGIIQMLIRKRHA